MQMQIFMSLRTEDITEAGIITDLCKQPNDLRVDLRIYHAVNSTLLQPGLNPRLFCYCFVCLDVSVSAMPPLLLPPPARG